MKLSVNKESLNKALSVVGRTVSQKASLPVLTNILITTEGGRLRLSSTNLESGIHYWVGAKVEEEGTITVPARVFIDFVSSLSDGETVSLHLIEDSLHVEAQQNKATLSTIAASEFPKIPVLSKEPQLQFSVNEFGKAVQQVAFAASQDEGRPVLTGVLIKVGKEETELVATDGYRLARKIIKTPSQSELEVIVPSRTLQEAARACLESEDEFLGVSIEQNQILFGVANVQITTRLLGGTYPNYQQIIPKSALTKVTFDKAKLNKALKVASIFARDIGNVVKLDFSESGQVSLSAITSQLGEGSSNLEAKLEGESLKSAYNARYLGEVIASISASQLVFESAGPLNPAIIKGVGEDNFFALIMPVKVQS